MQQKRFTFIDLFAGIGGFHIGLEKNGLECVYANEWDKHSALTYSNWFPNTHLDTRDLREVSPTHDIPKHDLLAGGFPCQPFSLAGVSKKNSLGTPHGFSDLHQGNLFFTICKIIKIHKPKVVFLENVKNLTSHNNGETWEIIQSKLNSLGYEIRWKIIDANAWVPQHRERIYIVAFRKKTFTNLEINSFKFPAPSRKYPTLDTILLSKPDKKYMLSAKLWRYLQNYAIKHKERGNGFGFSIADKKNQTRTLSARYCKDGSEILVKQKGWKYPRRLTPLEVARLMGFDDSWSANSKYRWKFPQVVSDTQAYRQYGNSVCPYVVKAVGKEISRVLLMRAERMLVK